MKKNLDKMGRWRNKVISFRVSPQENDLLDARVRLSGLTKQDYIIRKISDQAIIVYGNPKIFKALREELRKIYLELVRIENGEKMDSELFQLIQMVLEILNETKEKKPVCKG